MARLGGGETFGEAEPCRAVSRRRLADDLSNQPLINLDDVPLEAHAHRPPGDAEKAHGLGSLCRRKAVAAAAKQFSLNRKDEVAKAEA